MKNWHKNQNNYKRVTYRQHRCAANLICVQRWGGAQGEIRVMRSLQPTANGQLGPTCLSCSCSVSPYFTGTGSHVLARQVQVGQWSEQRQTTRLRSANVRTFVVPRTRTKLGDRSFAATGPKLWNSLPGSLRQSETLTTFKRQLNTFLFSD